MIYVTHDIDWATPSHVYAWLKCVTHGRKWLRINQIFKPNLFINQIEALIQLNQSLSIKPIWLLGATLGHTYQRYGLRYNLHTPSFNHICQLLSHSNQTIGLHSVANEPIQSQVQSLKKISQQPIHFHRSHFLKFKWHDLNTQLSNTEIEVDFSLGKAREIVYPKSTFNQDNATQLKCIPTILFDNIFFYQSELVVFEKYKQLLKEINTDQDIAICFHPENFLIMPAMVEYYQEIIRIGKTESSFYSSQ